MFIVFVLLGILIASVIVMYNNIIRLEKNVDKAKSGIEVYLQQRFDLIPNLIEVTKTYMNYEKDILEKIAQLRSIYNQNKDIKISNELNNQYKTIMAVVENYPELKSNEQFLKLQKTIIKIESQLQAARRIYNYDVTKYNTRISTFPNNFVARTFNFTNKDLFILEGEEKAEINL